MKFSNPKNGPFVEDVEGENVLSIRDVSRVLRNRAWVIALAMTVTVGVALGLSLLQTPQYEASADMLIGQESGIVENPGNVMGLQDLTQTMSHAIATRPVAEEVIRRLDLGITPEEFLEERLSANQVVGTQFIEIYYKDPDPETSQAVVNATGEVFSERVREVSPSAGALTATVWERAAVPDEPVSPNPLRNAALGLVVGALLGVGLAFVLEHLDDRWRSPEEAEQISGVPVFGVIPRFEMPKGEKKVKKKAGEEKTVVPLPNAPRHQVEAQKAAARGRGA